mmetsp:Transcript_42530/g.49646  ORF Transcript_42530/g.49646 Transcript_42530/m.49646 type:complete len:143 (-) Transcript_42530:901-1329(-)
MATAWYQYDTCSITICLKENLAFCNSEKFSLPKGKLVIKEEAPYITIIGEDELVLIDGGKGLVSRLAVGKVFGAVVWQGKVVVARPGGVVSVVDATGKVQTTVKFARKGKELMVGEMSMATRNTVLSVAFSDFDHKQVLMNS